MSLLNSNNIMHINYKIINKQIYSINDKLYYHTTKKKKRKIVIYNSYFNL